MAIKYYKTTEYNRHECHFKGDLLVFEVVNSAIAENKNKRWSGFRQRTTDDIIDAVKKWLKENNIEGKILLIIPDFVFRIKQ